jgi:rSAM/selenodomain-associated transferase 1
VSVAVIVLAKSPAPGRSKTRLCPPCTPAEAAALAEAALVDTLGAVEGASGIGRRILALEGAPGPWLGLAWQVVPQRGGGLQERLAAAFADVGGPALLVAMDTPQVSPYLIERAAASLEAPGVEAVLGPASDGGYWAIGLREPNSSVFRGVPMSTPLTLAAQRRRLVSLGIARRELPELRDVDTFRDAVEVASSAPWSRFARELAGLRRVPAGAGVIR